jgi:hypothetical protein
MPNDVLPEVNILVVTIVWTYTGLDTPEMEQRVTTYTEFALSNNVNGIRDMESTTLQGVTITRIYFQPDVSIDLALSQVTASTNSIRAVLPPGIQPPVVMRFSRSFFHIGIGLIVAMVAVYLLMAKSGLQVATVGADNAIHFQKVTIYRDFGTTAELRDGLAGGESLVLSPPTELADGSKVQVANPPQQQEGVKRTASR